MAWARVAAWQESGAASAFAEPPSVRIRLRRTRPRRSGLRGAALMGGVGLVAVLGLASLLLPPAGPPVGPPAPAGPPPWLDIERPYQLFALAGSAYARLPLDYTARRRISGTGREDWLTFGDPARPGPLLRLVVSRRGPVPEPAPDLVVDYARLAATAGHAVTRAGLPFFLPTRFGAFEAAELTLRAAGRTRACLGFRLQDTAGPIGMIGIACGEPDHPPERNALGCALDRIDLVAAGEDGAMRAFFTGAAPRRELACGGGPSLVKGAAAAVGSQGAARGT